MFRSFFTLTSQKFAKILKKLWIEVSKTLILKKLFLRYHYFFVLDRQICKKMNHKLTVPMVIPRRHIDQSFSGVENPFLHSILRIRVVIFDHFTKGHIFLHQISLENCFRLRLKNFQIFLGPQKSC